MSIVIGLSFLPFLFTLLFFHALLLTTHFLSNFAIHFTFSSSLFPYASSIYPIVIHTWFSLGIERSERGGLLVDGGAVFP